MSLSDIFKKSRISSRLLEEELYAETLRELERGIRRDGLWAKALAKSGANEEKAKALYIEFRVQAFRDELALYKFQLQKEEETIREPKPAENIDSNAKNRPSAPEEMLAREERIKASLRADLGREPTENEIDKAKWDGMCL